MELGEDPISDFFSLEECPKVMNLPQGISEETRDVIREEENLTEVFCQYGNCQVPLKSILDDLFFEHGRLRPHERVLCWFPRHL